MPKRKIKALTGNAGDFSGIVLKAGVSPECFEFLIEAGSDLHHRNARGRTVVEVVQGARVLNAGRKRILGIARAAARSL